MIQFDAEEYAGFVLKWIGGIDNEVFYWRGFFTQEGGEWPRAYQRRLEAEPECQLEAYALKSGDQPLRALDVGAGPISNVGIRSTRGPIELHACDALAEVYGTILDECGIEPYVKTEFALVERLTDVYDEQSFDVVNMENALDHSFDPFLGIAEMLRVAKIGGSVVLIHAEDEAERESYNGFHQWNITERDGRLVIWRGESEFVIDEVFGDYAELTTTRQDLGNLFLIRSELHKTAHPPRKAEPLLSAYDQVLIDLARRGNEAVASAPGSAGELQPVQSSHEQMMNSRSWRYTRPLRVAVDLGRKLKAGLAPPR